MVYYALVGCKRQPSGGHGWYVRVLINALLIGICCKFRRLVWLIHRMHHQWIFELSMPANR